MALGLGPISSFAISALPTFPVYIGGPLFFTITARIDEYIRVIWGQQNIRPIIAVEINYISPL